MFRYQVCCDVYRFGELLIEENFLLHDPIECEENEFDEENAYMLAQENLEAEIEKRIAEECLENAIASFGNPDDDVQFEYDEPNYGAHVVELYCDFRIKKVDLSKDHFYPYIDMVNDDE